MLIVLMVGALFLLLIAGLGLIFGSIVIDWTFDEAVPSLTTLGTVGSANLTDISHSTIVPVNNIVQSFTWLTGVLYMVGLIACFGLAFAFRTNGNKMLMAFFFACMFLLILTSILISNIYEEFYNDGSDVGAMLHEYVLLSWLILYSPLVMSIVGFICGIIMFSGEGVQEGVA